MKSLIIFNRSRLSILQLSVAFFSVTIIFLSLTVVEQSFHIRNVYDQIETTYQEKVRLETLRGQLRIEHGTWVAPAEVESRAREEIGMVAPAVPVVIPKQSFANSIGGIRSNDSL